MLNEMSGSALYDSPDEVSHSQYMC